MSKKESDMTAVSPGKKKEKTILDKPAFILSIIIVLAVSIPIFIWPDATTQIINAANSFVLKYFGSYYMLFAIGVVISLFVMSFTKLGDIVLGGPDAKPEYGTLTWIAMIVCSGYGSGIVLWGATEWIYYFQNPPYELEPFSNIAGEWALGYGMFHWGILGNTIYVIGAAAVGYMMFIRNRNVLRLNDACEPVLKSHKDKFLGTLVNVSFVFGLVGASVTTLGCSTPMVAAALAKVFGLEYTVKLQVITMVIVSAIFGTSVTMGMKKGIARLSNINIIISCVVLLWVFVTSNPFFIIDEAVTSTGLILQNTIRMSTWLDPIGKSNFPQDWTVFYWAFYVAFGPFMSIFLARVSKGRTIRSMLIAGTLGCSFACWLHFAVLGGHGLWLQTSGQLDVVASLNESGQGQTVINEMAVLPGGNLLILLVAILCIIFLATQFDSAAYVLGAATQKNLDENGDPSRWLRMLWAFMIFLVPLGFIVTGAPLSTLKTMVIVLALPLSFVVIITIISFFKMVYEDRNKGIFTLRKSWFSEIKGKYIDEMDTK